MRTVLLLRHAKSSWADPALGDHDRPLNGRGRRDAPRVGRFMAEAGLVPDYVLCSTARRARETLAAAAAEWDDAGVMLVEQDALYPTDPETCIELLRSLPAELGRVLVVGHNPGLEELLTDLTGRAETLPTAALVEVALLLDHWSDLSAATPGRLVRLWRPKDAPAVA